MRRSIVAKICFLTLAMGFCSSYKSAGGRYSKDEKIYRNGLMAVKNFFETQDAIREELDDLEMKEQKIKQKKEKIDQVARSFQGIFPNNSRRIESQTRNFLKQLRNLEEEPKRVLIQEPKSKKTNAVKGLVIGGVVAVAGIALGLILGMGSSKRSKSEEVGNKDFLRFLTKHAQNSAAEIG